MPANQPVRGRFPFCFRYSAGGTLSAYIQTHLLTEDKALYFFLQIVSALEFCHSKARPRVPLPPTEGHHRVF